MEDPPPGFGSEGGTLSVRTADCVAQITCASDAHEFGPTGYAVGGKRCDTTACNVDDGKRTRGHRLILDGPQNGLSERRVPPGDKDRADGTRSGTQPAIRRKRRLSRSDMPPQMPKRSSLARAYSRQSSRTWQA